MQRSLYENEQVNGALISECGLYRYRLWRIWDTSRPLVLWVMLNPSKADAMQSDRTIDKLIRLTSRWHYGGFYVGNIFPYRSTDPEELVNVGFDKAIGENNKDHIREMANLCELKILAHGNPPIPFPDYKRLFPLIDWHYLKLTKQGNPYHPLYLKETLVPIKM